MERPPDTTTGEQDPRPQEEADQLGAQPTPQTQEWEVGPVYLLSPPVPTQYSVELTFSFQFQPVGRYPSHFDFLFSDRNVRALSAVAGEGWLGGGDVGPGSTRRYHFGWGWWGCGEGNWGGRWCAPCWGHCHSSHPRGPCPWGPVCHIARYDVWEGRVLPFNTLHIAPNRNWLSPPPQVAPPLPGLAPHQGLTPEEKPVARRTFEEVRGGQWLPLVAPLAPPNWPPPSKAPQCSIIYRPPPHFKWAPSLNLRAKGPFCWLLP